MASMGKQVAQGTAWESTIRTAFGSTGAIARRNAKTGRKHEADVTVEGIQMLPLVAWKHYSPAGSRRKTLALYIVSAEDFHRMYRELPGGEFGFHIQAKATQRLSVPAVYAGLKEWVKHHA